MGLADELRGEVSAVLSARWSVIDGRTVPESDDLKLSNEARILDATVLYSDLASSTVLVDSHKAEFATEIYKIFLHCAARVIRSEGGEITAYDGDRVMAIFLGDNKNTSAARTALKLTWVRDEIINPAIGKQYPRTDFRLKHVTGIDTSSLFVARTGVRGANDLVWVGRAANHAAKLAALPANYAARISKEVYNVMNTSVRQSNSQPMWEEVTWSDMNRTIFRSNWRWRL